MAPANKNRRALSGKRVRHRVPPEHDDPEPEALSEHGRLRFTRLGKLIGGVSQKMLTKTVRQMEADGIVSRTVFPVIPPRVEYELTAFGNSWQARKSFQERAAG